MRRMALLMVIALVGGCSGTAVSPMGRDTYMMAKDGSFTTFGGGSVKAELYREADAYCRSNGKQLLPINESGRDSGYGRYANAEIQFRCLADGDPELRRPTMERAPDIVIKTN